MPDFRTTCHIHAGVLALLFFVYLLIPWLPLLAFDQAATPEAQFAVRRAGVIFLGLAAMLMLVRGLPASLARQAIVIGLIVIWGGLALFGLQATLRGLTGITAWGTIIVEAALAVLLVPHLRAGPDNVA